MFSLSTGVALFAVCGVMALAFALLWACCAISARCEDGDGWRHAGGV